MRRVAALSSHLCRLVLLPIGVKAILDFEVRTAEIHRRRAKSTDVTVSHVEATSSSLADLPPLGTSNERRQLRDYQQDGLRFLRINYLQVGHAYALCDGKT